MPTYTQANRPVRISTPLGQDVLLVKSLTGGERLGQPFQYDLVLASEGHELDYKKLIGQNVTVFVDKEGKEPRFFNGFISRFAQTKYEQKLAEYHATIVPWLWFLTRSSDCRIFQSKTIPEILKQVFDDHGFSDIIDRLHGSYRKWDYCVQYRETAYDFVSRLMEEEGIYYYFKHEKDKHTLVLCDSPASHKQFGGYEELLYRPSSASVQETLWTWVVQHEVQPGGYATTDFDFTTPRKGSLAANSLDRGHSHGQFEKFDYLGEQSPFNEGERYSKLRLEELQAQHETYSGEGDARGACTGVRFVLKGHPRKEFEKEYLTTGVEYLIRANPLGTGSEQGEAFEYNARMTAMLLEEQFRAPRITPKPLVHGPQTAIVVGPKGEKIYTDEYGRVKVQFHWDRRGNKDENSSCWVRVSQGWAGKPQGKNWGDMAIPHIGDEVIVECLEGDPDRPIITGRVYNQANMPPMELPTNKHKRAWCDDYGNELIFDATPGDEHIVLRSPHHNSGITLGRSSTTFTESNAMAATYGDNLNWKLGCNMDVTVGAYAGVTFGGTVAGVIGASYAFNVAAQCSANFGPQFAASAGIKYEKKDSDFFNICEGHVVISAGKVLNLVGGAGPKNGTSILSADDDTFELSVGEPMNVQPVSYAKSVIAGNVLAAIFPLAAGLSLGFAGGFVNEYNAEGDDQAKTRNKQIALETTAAVCEALSIVSLILAFLRAKKELTSTAAVFHNDCDARLRLEKNGTASLYGKTAVNVHFADKGFLQADKDAIKLAHVDGEVIILSGTNGVKIAKGGAMTITGPSVKIAGSFDVDDGALEVMGPPKPIVNPVTAAAAKTTATNGKLKGKRVRVKVAMKANQAASTLLP